MNEQVVASIHRALDQVEAGGDALILLAVESGSRAWGFPSADSDYDVRFIYVRPSDWYLAIDLEEKRDVIEYPLRDSIDLCGWDLRKALRLFRKSNPPLLEWLQCPIVYRERCSLGARLRAMLPDVYSPGASFYHYLHMARGNIREYLSGDSVWRKKYFYVLRPLLAMRWIEQGLGPVPIEFAMLVDATVADPAVREAIGELLAAKRAGVELDRGPRMPVLSEFIATEMARLGGVSAPWASRTAPVAALNGLFRVVLEEAWRGGARPPAPPTGGVPWSS